MLCDELQDCLTDAFISLCDYFRGVFFRKFWKQEEKTEISETSCSSLKLFTTNLNREEQKRYLEDLSQLTCFFVGCTLEDKIAYFKMMSTMLFGRLFRCLG